VWTDEKQTVNFQTVISDIIVIKDTEVSYIILHNTKTQIKYIQFLHFQCVFVLWNMIKLIRVNFSSNILVYLEPDYVWKYERNCSVEIDFSQTEESYDGLVWIKKFLIEFFVF
jgi:hypothetical protein